MVRRISDHPYEPEDGKHRKSETDKCRELVVQDPRTRTGSILPFQSREKSDAGPEKG